mmetsp:Transcript_45130/g.107319  ORF Transcript_45130/g.107319 Transcript_45130/m.107319 type:complete len:264 (+) Transcript_45130:8042-8833(+)
MRRWTRHHSQSEDLVRSDLFLRMHPRCSHRLLYLPCGSLMPGSEMRRMTCPGLAQEQARHLRSLLRHLGDLRVRQRRPQWEGGSFRRKGRMRRQEHLSDHRFLLHHQHGWAVKATLPMLGQCPPQMSLASLGSSLDLQQSVRRSSPKHPLLGVGLWHLRTATAVDSWLTDEANSAFQASRSHSSAAPLFLGLLRYIKVPVVAPEIRRQRHSLQHWAPSQMHSSGMSMHGIHLHQAVARSLAMALPGLDALLVSAAAVACDLDA